MKAKMDIPIIIFAFFLVYIIVMIASVFIQKVSLAPNTQPYPAGLSTEVTTSISAPQAYLPEIVSPAAPKMPSSLPHSSKTPVLLAAPPEVPAPELTPAEIQTAETTALPNTAPSQQADPLFPYPVIYIKSIPTNQDIEGSIAAEKQKQEMVESLIAQRRKQEAKVRAAVENAPPRKK